MHSIIKYEEIYAHMHACMQKCIAIHVLMCYDILNYIFVFSNDELCFGFLNHMVIKYSDMRSKDFATTKLM